MEQNFKILARVEVRQAECGGMKWVQPENIADVLHDYLWFESELWQDHAYVYYKVPTINCVLRLCNRR